MAAALLYTVGSADKKSFAGVDRGERLQRMVDGKKVSLFRLCLGVHFTGALGSVSSGIAHRMRENSGRAGSRGLGGAFAEE